MKLSLLTILLGAGLSVPQIYGLARPKDFAANVRKFPRNYQEPIADFSAYKPAMLVGFTAVGVLSCVFVRDFLAARALAVIFLLLAKLMVDTGRPHLGESSFVLINQVLAYAFVVGGIWITISPWRLRDWLEWFTASDKIVRVTCALRLVFDLFLITLGLTVFRGM